MSIMYKRTGNRITVDIVFPTPGKTAMLEIISDRNNAISRMSDTSPRDPNKTPGVDRYPQDVDTWFPVIDIVVEPRMYAKVWLSGNSPGHIYFNSYMNHQPVPVQPDKTAIIDAKWLVDWENGLYVQNKSSVLNKFAVYKEIPMLPTISRKISISFDTLNEDWGGVITAYYTDEDGTLRKGESIAVERPQRVTPDRPAAASGLHEALDLCVDYIIRSRNYAVNSPQRDGLYLFYDVDADTYRNAQWPWSWGPAIRLLLDAAELGGLSYTPDELRKQASDFGDCTLRFQIDNPGHIAHNFGTTRYSPRTYEDIGYQELVNTGSDAGFLAGWCWGALYKATKDQRYLNALAGMVDALVPVLKSIELPPQEWLPARRDWTDFTIDESGFGTEAIDALYGLTGDEKYKSLCAEYIDQHTVLFERPDGLWQRQYNFKAKTVDDTIFMTRGMGWALEGLMAAYRCTRDSKYLEKATKMADEVIRHQNSDGSWSFQFDRESGVADKGTTLWCLLLYMLHELSNDYAHLAAARAALDWCVKNQYKGENPYAYGGIIGMSEESGVIYRPWFKTTCLYSSAFFGLAILKELKLQK